MFLVKLYSKKKEEKKIWKFVACGFGILRYHD